ncbi:MAG: LysR family transcriptional regulator [Halocynthiibacter sp.]
MQTTFAKIRKPVSNAFMNDWDNIRFFLAVAREGSFSAAARKLNVNHSTVARRIQNIEEQYGVKLFNQTTGGYEITEAGASIFNHALTLECTNQKISRTLVGQDSRLEGTINLTMPDDLFEHFLAPHLARFSQDYPAITINLMLSNDIRDLEIREADLALRITRRPPENLAGRKIVSLREAIYAPADFDPDKPVNIIGWNEDHHRPDWAQQYFPECQIAMRADHLAGKFAALKTGIGLTSLPCYLPDFLQDKRVVKLPLDLPDTGWALWVLYHADLQKNARMIRCRSMLIDAIRQHRGLFEGTSAPAGYQ